MSTAFSSLLSATSIASVPPGRTYRMPRTVLPMPGRDRRIGLRRAGPWSLQSRTVATGGSRPNVAAGRRCSPESSDCRSSLRFRTRVSSRVGSAATSMARPSASGPFAGRVARKPAARFPARSRACGCSLRARSSSSGKIRLSRRRRSFSVRTPAYSSPTRPGGREEKTEQDIGLAVGLHY